MAFAKCRIDECKRDFDTICAHCQSNFCSKHYFEHVKLANDDLIPLVDQLNSTMNSIQQHDPITQAFQQVEQWRQASHRSIDLFCVIKKAKLQVELERKMEEQMNKLHQLSRQVKELIHEGDASFKQIENIKKDIEESQKQCKILEKTDYFRYKLKPVAIDTDKALTDSELITSEGTLLSLEQKIKLNEFYGKKGQIWRLTYKATRDGFSSADFHRCCNNQGPTITVIKSQDGGYLFGGYTSVSWRSIGDWVEDTNGAFLFTLTNPHGLPPTKYPVINTATSIYDHKDYGPSFGGGRDLCVCDNSYSITNSYFDFPTSYNDTTQRGAMTFTGNTRFQTTEIEVYRLI